MTRTARTEAAHSRTAAALRWMPALAWALVVAFILPAGERPAGLALQFAAYLVLSLLLVNALRLRMTLRSACAMAVIAACLLISSSEAIEAIVLDQPTPDTMVPGLAGSVAGAALGFPLFKRIRRAELARAAGRGTEDAR